MAPTARSFEEDGFLVSPVFARDEVAEVQTELAAYMDRVTRALNLPYADTAPDAPFDRRIERVAERDPSYAHLLGAAVCTDAHHGERLQALAHDPRLDALAEALLGAPVGRRTVRVRGNSTAMGEHRHAWHSDVAEPKGPCASIRLTAWIPLIDTDAETGGLEVAVGKREAPFEHVKTGRRMEIPEPALAGVRTEAAVCPMGSALMLDRYTPHRAMPNPSGRTRWSLVVWMKPAA